MSLKVFYVKYDGLLDIGNQLLYVSFDTLQSSFFVVFIPVDTAYEVLNKQMYLDIVFIWMNTIH